MSVPRRRTVLTSAALGVTGVAALGTLAATSSITAGGEPSSSAGRFGFTIGSLGPEGEGSSVERVLEDVAEVATLGGSGVRLNAGSGTLLETFDGPDDDLVWNESAVAEMHRILAAAADAGLRVCLMVINHYDVPDAGEDRWLSKTTAWWEGLAVRFAAQVQQIQVFNEADALHYRRYEAVGDRPPAAYLRELASRITEAGRIFRAHSRDVQITTNLYGWPVGDDIEDRWHQVLTVLAPTLDLLTVDAYIDWADTGAETLGGLVDRIARLHSTYGKPVAIGELGDPTCSICSTQQEQAEHYATFLDVLGGAGDELTDVFFYQLRDRSARDESEETFGVMTESGSAKAAYNMLLDRGLS
ncbi:hypothetical protein ACFQS2_05005 [Brachybacterium sp. GCM10030267]|uniref:hypothetical protein n=1 Tax=Brachybacterium sp. GCM10030267 TaxID=3273381 RepID=UPI003617239F